MSAMAEEVSSWVVTEFAEIVFFSLNWLQVLGSTKLSQINESEGHQFEPKMSNLESLKT